jgi:hypothetical protein
VPVLRSGAPQWPSAMGRSGDPPPRATRAGKFDQFSVNPRRSPQRIRGAHLANERSNGRIRARATGTSVRRALRPSASEPLAMPGHHRVGVYDNQGRAPVLPGLGEQDPKQPIAIADLRTFDRAPEHRQLLTERHVLECDCAVSAADQRERAQHHDEHGQMRYPDAPPTTESTVRDCRADSGEAQPGLSRRAGFAVVSQAQSSATVHSAEDSFSSSR